MRKIYIHIGTHKTGSTFIQKNLNLNKEIFAKFNIHIPNVAREFEDLSNHCNLIFELLNNYKYEQNQFKLLIDDISRTNKNILISSETFEFIINKKKFLFLIDKFKQLNLKPIIICYNRNDPSFLVSRYIELIKTKKYNPRMKLPSFFIFFIIAFLKGHVEINVGRGDTWSCYFNNNLKKILKKNNLETYYISYEKNKYSLFLPILEILNLNPKNFLINSEKINTTNKNEYKKYYNGIYFFLSKILFLKRKFIKI